MPTAEILSQGDEVVTGQVADTNAAWLSTQLTDLGFQVMRHTSVGDRLDDLCEVLSEIASRTDFCIGTGGLGPTQDDLTAEATARTFQRPLQFDPDAMAQIEARYRQADREMPEVNRKQAWLPEGCQRLDNHWGTAPGFAVTTERALMAFVPGVPREMREMFTHGVRPLLHERFDLRGGRRVTLKTTGIGESNLQERIGDFAYDDVVLSFRTKLPENHLKLRFAPDASEDYIERVTADLAHRVGSPLFGIDTGSLAEVVAQALCDRQETVATAESCTGGLVGSMLTAIPGSSRWYSEGAITYANAAKIRMLGVEPQVLEAHGAVSEAVACQMATGIRERAGTTYGLATTGIAGPGGGTDTKPVGTVHIAVATADHLYHRHLSLGGSRSRIQTLSAAAVIDTLRRHLQNR